MRRKHQDHMDKFFKSMEECFEYVKRIKDINGDQISVEIYESITELGHYWFVEVWKVR